LLDGLYATGTIFVTVRLTVRVDAVALKSSLTTRVAPYVFP